MANLVLNGKSIDTIDEIAENFVEADVLREFQSGSLAAWLEEYGYEDELARIRAIKPTASNIRVLSGIIDALNLDDDVIARANVHRGEKCKEESVREACEEQKKNGESDTFVQMLRDEVCRNNDMTYGDIMAAEQLIKAIYFDSLQKISAGANPIAVKNGIGSAVGAVTRTISKHAKKVRTVEKLTEVATFFADGDEEIGNIISDAMNEVGYDGTLRVEESNTVETTLKVVEGMQFNGGYLSPDFVTDSENRKCVLENPYILLSEKKISNFSGILSLLRDVTMAGRFLLIISDKIDEFVLAQLIESRSSSMFKVCAVKVADLSDYGNAILEDIAVLTAGKFISEDCGIKLEDVTLDMLGKADKVIVDKECTKIIGGQGKFLDISARVAAIKKQIEETPPCREREKLMERLAKLAGGVAIIKVGAATEAVKNERCRLADYAQHASRAAAMEGLITDDGSLYQRCQKAIKKLILNGDEVIGANVVSHAINGYLRQLAYNADQKVDVKHHIVTAGKRSADKYVYLVKAVRCVLQNVASIIGNWLLSQVGGSDEVKYKINRC